MWMKLHCPVPWKAVGRWHKDKVLKEKPSWNKSQEGFSFIAFIFLMVRNLVKKKVLFFITSFSSFFILNLFSLNNFVLFFTFL